MFPHVQRAQQQSSMWCLHWQIGTYGACWLEMLSFWHYSQTFPSWHESFCQEGQDCLCSLDSGELWEPDASTGSYPTGLNYSGIGCNGIHCILGGSVGTPSDIKLKLRIAVVEYLRVKGHHTTAYNPQGNELYERFHHTMNAWDKVCGREPWSKDAWKTSNTNGDISFQNIL